MRIAVIGSGYVGLVAAACLAELGNQVICVDNDPAKVAALSAGQVPIFEEHLPELLARHRGRGLSFTGDVAEAVRGSEVVFIAVGTPTGDNGEPDLSGVEAAAREIATAIEDDFKVVVCKSTVPVYTCAWVRRVIVLNGAPRDGFDVVANPEFLREGTAVADFLYPDRIVIGADHDVSRALMQRLYAPLTSGSYAARPDAIARPDSAAEFTRLIVTSTKSAELIKHACNAFLALKISFINTVANICESVDADISEVVEGIGSDSRIGPKFLRAGIGYGGSCFPKDIAAFQRLAESTGNRFALLREVAEINQQQQQRFLRKLRSTLWTLKGKRMAVLGLAFKGGTDDIRNSPAVAIVRALLAEGAEIVAFDPAAMSRVQAEFAHPRLAYARDPYAAAAGADALLILTDWADFAALDLERLRQQLRYPILVDGRNLYDPDKVKAVGLSYISIGRPDAGPASLPEGVRPRPVKKAASS